MRFTRILFASAVVLAPAMTASAQSWSSNVTPANNGGQFWDNKSTDGTYCNIGYVLNKTAGSSSNKACANQRPGNWLPYAGDKPTHYLNNGSGGYQKFTFAEGTYTFALLPGAKPGGDIAGENTSWGYYTGSGSGVSRFDLSTNAELNSIGATTVTFESVWGLWVQLVDGSYAYSGNSSDKQFALFAFNNDGSFSGNTLNYAYDSHYIMGLEDTRDFTEAKTCLKYKTDWRGKPTSTCKEWSTPKSWKSDWDYNDIAFQITTPGKSISTVPEPSTYALMAAGLGALFMAARRRRRNG